MGGWKLEVVRMAIYMAFPVGLFHYFNHPQYYEEWVINAKREIWPPQDKADIEKLENAKREFQILRQIKALKAIEDRDKSL